MKLTLWLYTKVPSKWSKVSNITTNKPILLKENIAVNCNDLELGKDCPGTTTKKKHCSSIIHCTSSKIKTYALKNTTKRVKTQFIQTEKYL